MRAVQRRAAERAGRPFQVPDGYTHAQMKKLRKNAGRYADKVIKIMEEKNILPPTDELLDSDKEMAKEALRETIIILRTPGATTQKLAAARTILEYTRSKPVAKSDVSISGAEDFLKALAAKEQKIPPHRPHEID